MEIAIFWFIFAVICGIFAGQRGRSGFGYFVLAILISPLLCFILIAVLGAKKAPEEPATSAEPNQNTHTKCPDCAELVLKEAKKCKHCGATLTPVA